MNVNQWSYCLCVWMVKLLYLKHRNCCFAVDIVSGPCLVWLLDSACLLRYFFFQPLGGRDFPEAISFFNQAALLSQQYNNSFLVPLCSVSTYRNRYFQRDKNFKINFNWSTLSPSHMLVAEGTVPVTTWLESSSHSKTYCVNKHCF